MSKNRDFPFTWSPHWYRAYESTWSLAYRLSVANLVGAEHIYANLFAPLRQTTLGWIRSEGRATKWISDLLGVPESLVATSFLDDLASPLLDDVLIAKNLRYCPVCLTRHFHSSLFQFRILAECPIHKVLLQVGCPHCKTPFSGHPLDTAHDACCLHCGKPFIETAVDWRDVFNSDVDIRPLVTCRNQLFFRRSEGHIQGAIPSYRGKDEISGLIATLRLLLTGESATDFEVQDFEVHGLESTESTAGDAITAITASQTALRRLHSQLPSRIAAAFRSEYSDSFLTRDCAPPLGNPAVGAYRLVEEFLGVLAPPSGVTGDLRRFIKRFNLDFFKEHLEVSDHTRRLPLQPCSNLIAPLLVQSLYIDALEYIISDRPPGKPWTLWASEFDSFKYPIIWHGQTTGNLINPYQITAVTLASRPKLSALLADI